MMSNNAAILNLLLKKPILFKSIGKMLYFLRHLL
jgi:hypothetical protein